MGMRAFLAVGIGALATVLHDRSGLSQPAVGGDGEHGHAAAGVVGQQQELSGRIERQVAWPRSVRRLLVDQREPAGRRIGRERTHCAGGLSVEIAGLVDRENQMAAGVDREE